MDFKITPGEDGDFDPIRTEFIGVSGTDGYGQPTPTVRELALILQALPGEVQDLPVGRYCDDGIMGISYEVCFSREERDDVHHSTPHVQLW